MAIRAVLDANVWISGLVFPGGAPSAITDLAIRGPVELELLALVSEPIIAQIERSLRKFDVSESFQRTSISSIRSVCEIVPDSVQLEVIQAKPSDNRILECALSGRADVIVTGDKRHLLPLREFEGIPIIMPRTCLELVHEARKPSFG